MINNIYKLDQYSLISSKYKSTLSENKILVMALSRLNESEENYVVKLNSSEISMLLKNESNIYRTLNHVSENITKHIMFVSCPDLIYKPLNIITYANYRNGILTLKFNENISFENIKSFVLKYFSNIIAFENISSFKMYEYLQNKIGNINFTNYAEFSVNLYELYFLIGTANISNLPHDIFISQLQDEYLSLNNKDKEYAAWYDFKRYVLDPAQKELETKSDIIFDYIRENKREKNIIFKVFKNTPENKQKINNNNIINKINDDDLILKQIWLKYKKEDKYFDFLYDLEIRGIDTNDIENTYSKEELINLYIKWKKDNNL